MNRQEISTISEEADSRSPNEPLDRLLRWGCIATLSIVGLLSFLLLLALLFTE